MLFLSSAFDDSFGQSNFHISLIFVLTVCIIHLVFVLFSKYRFVVVDVDQRDHNLYYFWIYWEFSHFAASMCM